MGYGYVAEQGDFGTKVVGEGIFASAYQHVWLDSHSLKLFYTCLGGLGFHFTGSLQIWNQGYMNKDGIFVSYVMLELTDGFQERLAFDVSYCSAYLNDGDSVFIRGFGTVEAAFDLICDVGNDLYGSSPEVSVAFLLKNGPVNFSGGHVGIFIQAFINKALIVTKIQVGLGSVVGYEDFAVLDGVHGSGVDVDVGVKFLHGYLEASGF